LGWQLGVVGLGATLGSLAAPRFVLRLGYGRLLCAGLIAEAVCQILYAVNRSADVSLVIAFVWGLAASAFVVPFYSLLQSHVNLTFQGRIFSVVRQCEHTGVGLAMVVVLLVQDAIEPHVILLAGGCAYLVLATILGLTPAGRRILSSW
jgi:sugar phosphate permease